MTAINWLSTGFLFAFCVATPFTIYVLHTGGPKPAIITASVLLLLGNWIRYGGTRAQNYGVVLFGQILTGFAQPFVLSSPTHYSDLWFTNNGRVAATAIMTLANPLGGALGQLIDPFFAPNKGDIPNMVLYISIIVRSGCYCDTMVCILGMGANDNRLRLLRSLLSSYPLLHQRHPHHHLRTTSWIFSRP